MGLRKKTRAEALVISDIHVPFHDAGALAGVRALARAVKPRQLILNGDILDCYAISDHQKTMERAPTLQQEIDEAKGVIAALVKAAKGARVTMLLGNHEQRTERLVAKNPGLHGLRALAWESLLDAKKLGISQVIPYGKGAHYNVGSARVEHGTYTTIHASWKMLAERWQSGVSGHTHRAAARSRTVAGRVHTWIEQGCLCRLHAEWMTNPVNWQHGCSLIWDVGGVMRPELVQIHDGEVMYR